MNGVSVRIFSFLHAGSYTKEDAFEVAAPYQKYTELGWVASMDGVFVGSQYHKDAFVERRIAPLATDEDYDALCDKLIVVGNPLFAEDYHKFPDAKKENKIIISNRFDWEKRPNESLQFAYLAKKEHPDWEIVVTTSRPEFKSNKKWLVQLAKEMEKDGIIMIKSGLSKEQYHYELATSKVMLSNSIEENFGYCIVEALQYGTYPLLPNGLSHPELVKYNPMFLFDDSDEIMNKLEALMSEDCREETDFYLHRYYGALETIAEIMGYSK
jgi:glycosyltransferase involved in cell wall biosynthesis